MIIVLKPHSKEDKIVSMIKRIEDMGLRVERTTGVDYTILALVGDTSRISQSTLKTDDIVHKIIKVQEPFKRVNRFFKPEDTVVQVGEHAIGGGEFIVMAGPCSVENEKQLLTTARCVKESGAHFLRGGAYKPRTSPYAFQGLGKEGLDLLKLAKEETGLGIVTELLSIEQLDLFMEDVDIIQVGARNMQNFSLLKELGKTDKPILLKRGISATIEEWLMSAEYIMSEGNKNIILCERGIRTYEGYTRNTLDLSAVPMVKRLSHLPVIVDPSHAAGLWWMVEPLSKGAIVVGADGLMVEVHPEPEKALSDGAQSLRFENFRSLMGEVEVLVRTQGKSLKAKKKGKMPWMKD